MIISVINLKGGSGKTTTAMALATAAARHNRNVSVLDTDPQGDATTWAGDAEDAGETLTFTVDSANIGKLKRLRKTMADDELVIIDCPPAGNVVDVACDVSDFVIVPATQAHSNSATRWKPQKASTRPASRTRCCCSKWRTTNWRATRSISSANAVPASSTPRYPRGWACRR